MSSNGADNTNQAQDSLDELIRHGGSRRYPAAAQLPGATAFSKQGKVRSSRWLFETIARLPWIVEALDAVEIDRNWGRRREPGRWAWLYLDFVVSDAVDVQAWYDRSDESVWELAGFTRKFSYPVTYERFTELEERWPAYEAAAGLLIRHARQFEPQVGMYLHVDSTEAETHAAFVHDCTVEEGCPWAIEDAARRARHANRRRELAAAAEEEPPDRLDLSELDTLTATDDGDDDADDDGEAAEQSPTPSSGKRPPLRPDRVPTAVQRSERQKQAEEAPEDGRDYGVAQEVVLGPDFVRVRVGNHWYRSLDPTAGCRAYKGKHRQTVRFWHGFYNTKMTDHYTGAPVVIGLYSASQQEYNCYEDMLDRATAVLGEPPRAVVGDRGYSVTKVFRLNTSRGVASVFFWRKSNASDKRTDGALVDRHGVPRCKHCGAPCEFVRFHHEPTPRLWVRCLAGRTPECVGEQSLACSRNWRALLPLWRDDPVYMELRRTHQEYEATHDYWRDRYKVGPSSLGQRPKRRGRDWQQLRASAALFVEWLRICYREGWLGDERSNLKQPRCTMEKGTEAALSLRQFRTRIGLNAPYGPKAVAAYGTRRYRRAPSERWALQCRWQERRKQRRAEEREAREQQAA